MRFNTERSKEPYDRAMRSIPGGASSASRTPLEGYGPYPAFVDRAEGSKLYDVDGNEYIDYLLALGPTLVGNANPRVLDFVSKEALGGCFEQECSTPNRLSWRPPMRRSSEEIYMDFRNRMLHRGVFLRPVHMGTIYLSLAHTDEDVDRTLSAASEVVGGMRAEEIL
jgi:glutamate-1-semialdehyde aminotransferase